MNELKLSASAIEAFKACPARFLLRYIYGWQPEKEKDSLRIGTNWHRCHEILHLKPKTKCPDCLRREDIRPDCDLCAGTGILPSDLMESVVRFLNRTYAIVPEHKTRDEWEIERIKILYSLSGYYWHYGWEDEFETIGVEIWFDQPILNPATGSHKRFATFISPAACVTAKHRPVVAGFGLAAGSETHAAHVKDLMLLVHTNLPIP